MFANDIINSDPFLDMGQGAQLLYFHLGMQADDDGFVSPHRVMRMVGASVDDLKVLEALLWHQILTTVFVRRTALASGPTS